MSMVADGRIDEIQELGGKAGMDARNRALQAQHKTLSLETALAVCLKERAAFLVMLDRVSDGDLHRQIRFPWGWHTRMSEWAEWRAQHDAGHALQLVRWRRALPRWVREAGQGPTSLLRALAKSTRKELLTVAALAPEDERDSRALYDGWTLKDVLGHLSDWERWGVEALRQFMTNGRELQLDFEGEIGAWNQAHVTVRRQQSWARVRADFHDVRQALLTRVDELGQQEWERTLAGPWGRDHTVTQWVLLWLAHEREHAAALRAALRLPDLPQHLIPH
jgi:hypothetical protein